LADFGAQRTRQAALTRTLDPLCAGNVEVSKADLILEALR
jgi:hypothetical protein